MTLWLTKKGEIETKKISYKISSVKMKHTKCCQFHGSTGYHYSSECSRNTILKTDFISPLTCSHKEVFIWRNSPLFALTCSALCTCTTYWRFGNDDAGIEDNVVCCIFKDTKVKIFLWRFQENRKIWSSGNNQSRKWKQTTNIIFDVLTDWFVISKQRPLAPIWCYDS